MAWTAERSMPLDFAQWYASLGYRVIPVHAAVSGVCSCPKGSKCQSPAKHPKTRHGCKDATRDDTEIKRWFTTTKITNVGIATGAASNLLVIDVDPRHGGNASMTALTKQLGKLPPHPVANTGGGGFHLLFTRPAEQPKNRIGIADGIDIRCDNGFIVAPPSVHASGGKYSWRFSPDDFRPPDLPETWINWLGGADVTQKAQKARKPR